MARFQRAPNFITPPIKIQQNTLDNFHFDLQYDPTRPSSRRPSSSRVNVDSETSHDLVHIPCHLGNGG